MSREPRRGLDGEGRRAPVGGARLVPVGDHADAPFAGGRGALRRLARVRRRPNRGAQSEHRDARGGRSRRTVARDLSPKQLALARNQIEALQKDRPDRLRRLHQNLNVAPPPDVAAVERRRRARLRRGLGRGAVAAATARPRLSPGAARPEALSPHVPRRRPQRVQAAERSLPRHRRRRHVRLDRASDAEHRNACYDRIRVHWCAKAGTTRVQVATGASSRWTTTPARSCCLTSGTGERSPSTIATMFRDDDGHRAGRQHALSSAGRDRLRGKHGTCGRV